MNETVKSCRGTHDLPLVTIAIITYNSEKTIIETLESIKVQTYNYIELIISDDCSFDNTVQICRTWLLNNKTRFKRFQIIESDHNTGISCNCNRAISNITGKYLKLLAGDDLLEPGAISEYVRYVIDHPQAIFVFSRVMVFGNDKDSIDYYTNNVFDYTFFSLDSQEQYERLIGHWCAIIPASSSFVNVEVAKDFNVLFFDERIPMLEDWSKWIQLSSKGIKFHFIDKQLVRYRVSSSSVSVGEKHKDSFRSSLALLYRYYQFKPSIRLFGFKHALAVYIRKKADANNKSMWGFLQIMTTFFITVRDNNTRTPKS